MPNSGRPKPKPSQQALLRASLRLFKECFRLKKAQRVAIVVDGKSRIAYALETAALMLGAKIAGKITLSPLRAHSSPIPSAAKIFAAADIVAAPTTKSISHSPQTREARKNGTRFATMPSITEELFVKAMNADFGIIRKNCGRLKRILDNASVVRVASANGTDIALDVSERKFEADDGVLWKRGRLCNVPFGEVCTAPTNANGIIVPNSMRHSAKMGGTIFVENGRIVRATGGATGFLRHLDRFGKCGRVVGELGIGTNPAFKKSMGLILQDEKIAGSAHVAFGASCCYRTNKCGVHEDVVVENVRLWADGKEIKHQTAL
ncbi:MAG: aminopeptidase [Candidatus Micrarchaeia archaeon]|jgi:leucyl aminopeptidase (aminopeptidase T)